MQIQVWASGDQIQWSDLQLTRLLPAGLFGQDTDISAVKLWQSITNPPIFHRDVATQQDVGDVLVGQTTFGAFPQPTGQAAIAINDPTINNPGYTLITSSTKTFYV